MREIFRKVPLSEKKALFKKGSEEKWGFLAKGEGDDLVTLQLDEYVDGKVLTFNYAPQSAHFFSDQNLILNFSSGEDRYFLQAPAEIFEGRVHIPVNPDVYILQRRKSPRLEIPEAYPAKLNILNYQTKSSLHSCKILDFGSGGCKVEYVGHLPAFKSGDKIKAVVHLNRRNPTELDCEIRHHVMDQVSGTQTFGVQFKPATTILENKMLVVFMDLQRELFIKWNTEG